MGEEGTVHSVGGSGLGASDNLGNLHNGDAQRDERVRAVRRHAERALRETLLTSWEETVESERARAGRTHMEALERELTQRSDVARKVIAEIRQSVESQVAVTVQAAQAVAEAALSGVADRLTPRAAPTSYQPPSARTLDDPARWEAPTPPTEGA